MAGDTPLGKPPFGSAGLPRASATTNTLPTPKSAPPAMSPSVASSSPESPASAPSAKATPEQRTVKCPKCGVDFLKYIVAVVDAKKQSRDTEQERFDRRTGLVKNILAIPLTGGLSLLALFRPKKTPAK
jgi:hypothetical protein